ncbi:hypothetical protein Tco_0984321 [Tanacetum coccineum]
MAAFKVRETQFQMFIKSRIYLDDEYVTMTRNYFLEYTQLEILEFHDTLIQHMESVKKSIDERAQHKREYHSKVNERQMQTIEEKVDTSNALDASLVDTKSSGTESGEQDTSNRSGNDAHVDDADIRPIYDEEPMAENAEQCHDKCPLPAKLTDNQITKLSYQSLKSENICLKKTVAQFQKDFLRMEAHCVNLELKYQNQALKEGQHGQFSKVKSNEAKVKHDIDVIETINIELEHKVAKLLKENETLKKHYKELYDSIKATRTKTIEQTTSLIAKNVEFRAQLQEKGFAIAALKNELRKLTGNSVNTKWVPTGKIFTSSTTKVDSEPTNGSNEDITNQYECEQTLDVSACTLNLSAGTSFNPKKEGLRVCSELKIHDHGNEPSSSKLVPKVVPPADKTATSQQELELLFSPMYEEYFNAVNLSVSKSSALSDNLQQHDTQPTANIPVINPPTNVNAEENIWTWRHLISAKSDSLPHAYAQSTKSCYKHQDPRIKKAQELKTETSTNSDIKDNSSETKLRGRLLESFQEDAKYEHVGQDTRSQGGKDNQDKQGKDLKISKSKTKSKDNDKGSRSKITQHEGTSLLHNKDQRFKNSTTKQSQQVQGSKIQDLTSGIQRPHIKGDC